MEQRNIFIVTYRNTLGDFTQVMINTSLCMTTMPDIDEVLVFLRGSLNLPAVSITDWKLMGITYYSEDDLPTILPVPKDYDSPMSGVFLVTYQSNGIIKTETLYDLAERNNVNLLYFIIENLTQRGYDNPVILNCTHIADYFDYNPAGIKAVDVLKANDTI